MTDREPRGKAHGKPGDTKRDDPRRQAVAPLDARDALGVDLKAGKQEQKGQTELGHKRDLGIYMDDAEHMGSQHRAEHEQKDRLGNGFSRIAEAIKGLAKATSAMMVSETNAM